MSQFKPEVGDVWGLDEYIARVLFVSENSVRYLTPNFVGCHPMIVTREKWWFVRAFKYLGKSKVSIKELFDTVNDTVNDTVRSENEKEN